MCRSSYSKIIHFLEYVAMVGHSRKKPEWVIWEKQAKAIRTQLSFSPLEERGKSRGMTATAEFSKPRVRMSWLPAASSARPLHRLPSIVPATVEHAVDDSTRQQRKLLSPSRTRNQICVVRFFHNPTVVNVRKPCEQCSDYHSLDTFL